MCIDRLHANLGMNTPKSKITPLLYENGTPPQFSVSISHIHPFSLLFATMGEFLQIEHGVLELAPCYTKELKNFGMYEHCLTLV